MPIPPQLMPLDSKATLPTRVSEALRRDISAHYAAGDRLPSMQQLAEHLAVSINTVSAALALLARDGVVEKRHGSGVYVTARAQAWRIGLLSELDLLDARIGPFFRALAGAVKRRLQTLGAVPLLYVGNVIPGMKPEAPTCPQFWADVAAGQLDGAVLLDVPSTHGWWERVQACPIPAVGELTNYQSRFDHAGMIAAAVQHLAAGGCRRLGLIATYCADEFCQAVATHRLHTHDGWICGEVPRDVRGSGADALRRIWAAPERPDGLVILDDMLFQDALPVMQELALRVPQDVRLTVLATEGVYLPSPYPYTALANDSEAEAAMLVELLLQQLRGEVVAPVTAHVPFHLTPVTGEESPIALRPAALAPGAPVIA
jgi:DNA-binding LacI/PurR family transcriptional regulator